MNERERKKERRKERKRERKKERKKERILETIVPAEKSIPPTPLFLPKQLTANVFESLTLGFRVNFSTTVLASLLNRRYLS